MSLAAVLVLLAMGCLCWRQWLRWRDRLNRDLDVFREDDRG